MTGLLGETQDEFYTISFAPYDYPLVEPFIFNQMIRERIQKIFSSASARQFVKNMEEVIENGIDVSPVPVYHSPNNVFPAERHSEGTN